MLGRGSRHLCNLADTTSGRHLARTERLRRQFSAHEHNAARGHLTNPGLNPQPQRGQQ